MCHSIQGQVLNFADWLGIDSDQIRYTAGGINHIDFYLTLTNNGRNLYPILLDNKDKILKEHPEELVRFELLENLGFWPAEGPHHQTEYYGWFRKNPDSANHYKVETMWGYNWDTSHNKYKYSTEEDQGKYQLGNGRNPDSDVIDNPEEECHSHPYQYHSQRRKGVT